MTRRARLTRFLATAFAVLAAAWLVAQAIFRLALGTSVTIAAAVDAVVLGGLAVYFSATGEDADVKLTSDHASAAMTVLHAKVRSTISEQVHSLTNHGTIEVPWTWSSPAPRSRAIGRSINDLANHVAGGGQLIVFGESQSGKTTLATRIVAELSKRSDRQPILFTVSTWNPDQHRLRAWMLQTIQNSYGLSEWQLDVAATALDGGRIIPVFDGLDEIDPSQRVQAAHKISSLVGTGSAVLTAIPTPATKHAAHISLPSARSIELRPIKSAQITRYLLGAPENEDVQWKQLTGWLAANPGTPLAEALSSPFMAWLAKSVYAVEITQLGYQPSVSVEELKNISVFPTSASVEKFLLRNIALSVFDRLRYDTRIADVSGAFRPRDAQRWLAFLASRADKRIIAFWEIRRYAPLYRLSLAIALVGGAAVTLAQISPVVLGQLYLLLAAGGFFGFAWSRGYASARDRERDPTRIGYDPGLMDGDLALHLAKLGKVVLFVVTGMAATLLLSAALGESDYAGFRLSGLQWAVGIFLAIGLACLAGYLGSRIAAWLLLQLPAREAGTGARAGDPLLAIDNDRHSAYAIFVVSSCILVAGVVVYHAIFPALGTDWAVFLAPVGGLVATFFWDEWVCFKVAHIYLVLRHQLPVRFSLFLGQCHSGGILRKNGNFFEFRHARLQESLEESGSAV